MNDPKYVTKDSGHRQVFATGAQRDRQEGKGRYDLIPAAAIKRIADIFERGSLKYFTLLPITNLQLVELMLTSCTCKENNHIVIHIFHTMQEVCAGLATKEIFGKEIQNLLNVKITIPNPGVLTTKNKRERLTKIITLLQEQENEENLQEKQEPLLDLVSHLKTEIASLQSKDKSVLSVNHLQAHEDLTQTMITSPVSSEDFSVQNAIKELVFSEILLRVYNGHSPTCKIHHIIRQENNQLFQWKTGDRNWEQGMPLSRYVDSALRHLFQYLEGRRDEDHAGQAAWNCIALLHTETMIQRGLLPQELNDLPTHYVDYDPDNPATFAENIPQGSRLDVVHDEEPGPEDNEPIISSDLYWKEDIGRYPEVEVVDEKTAAVHLRTETDPEKWEKYKENDLVSIAPFDMRGKVLSEASLPNTYNVNVPTLGRKLEVFHASQLKKRND